jgi:hypothetical protein
LLLRKWKWLAARFRTADEPNQKLAVERRRAERKSDFARKGVRVKLFGMLGLKIFLGKRRNL